MLKTKERYSLLGVFLLSCTSLFLSFLGVDFSFNHFPTTNSSVNTPVNIFEVTSRSILHTFLEWTSVIFIFITTLIVFRKYFVFKEKTLIFWAVSLLVICVFDVFHILATDNVITFESLETDPVSFTWTISRLVHSSIYLLLITVNLWVFINYTNRKILNILISRYLFLIFSCFGLFLAVWIFFNFDILQVYYPDNFVVRPLDLIPLVIFSLVFLLLIIRYERKKSYLVFYLLLSLIPEIFAQLHMAFGSKALFDHHFNIAYFFKLAGHFILLYGSIVSLSATVTEHSLRTYKRRVLEQKDNVNKITELSEKSEAVLNTMAEAVINIDSNFNIVLCNQSAEEMFEISADFIKEKPFNSLLAKDENQDKEIFYQRLKSELNSKVNVQNKTEYLLFGVKQRSGELFLCNVVVTCVYINKEYLFTILLRDLTTQKILEQEKELAFNKVNEIASRLDFALDAANIGVWDYNLKTKKINWDHRVYQLLGYSPTSSISPNKIWRKVIHKEDYTMVKEKLSESITTKKELNFIFRIIKPNKDVCYIETQAKIFEDNSQYILHLIGTNEDVTERLNVEQLKQKALDMAQESSNMKSEFLACMSHEIRTPMNGVIGMLGLLSKTELSRKQAYYLHLASSSAETLLTLINDILDFSKIEAGKLEIEKREFSITDLLENTAQSMALSAKEKGLEYTIDLSQVNYCYVIGDQTRLQQILINLINNAVKFTAQGGISLIFSLKQENDLLRFDATIRDTGIGISKEKQQALFDPFTQIDASTTRKYGGTGLGLAIVKKLCRLMNGEIRLDSRVGEGSEFGVTLFFEPSELKNNQIAQTKNFNSEPIASEPVSASKFLDTTILLVEDNSINQLVVIGMLENLGLTVDVANNGVEAIKVLSHSPDKYQLILMDCQMPEMDGYQTTQHIRQQIDKNINADVVIIAMTANAMKEDEEKCLQVGMNDYIAKPVSVEIITEKLIYWFNFINNTQFTSFSEFSSSISSNTIKNCEHNKEENDNSEGSLSNKKGDFQILTWDKAALLKRLRYNQLMVEKLIAMFIEDNQDIIANFTEQIKNRNDKQIAALAHKIKGSALNLSFNKLAKIASDIEKQAKSLESVDYSDLFAAFIEEFSQLMLIISPNKSK